MQTGPGGNVQDMPNDVTPKEFPDQTPEDKSFGAAAAEKEERADQLREDGMDPAAAQDTAGPAAAGKAAEGTPPA